MTAANDSAAPGAPPAHILVVDDVEKNTRLLADLLGAKGYRTSTASSGQQALDLIAAAPPDLVLLDVMMPGMSGYEVCQTLRGNPRHALLPVVLVTALDPAVERVKGLDAGADDFLNKPINQAELLARVRSLLRVKALQDELLRARPAAPTAPPPARHNVGVVLCIAWPGLDDDAGTAEPAALLARLQGLQVTLAEQARQHGATLVSCHAQGMSLLFDDAGPQPDTPTRSLRLATSLQAMGAGLQIGMARGRVAVGSLARLSGERELVALGPAVGLAGRLSQAAGPDEVLASADLAADLAAEWGDAAQDAGRLVAQGGAPAVAIARVLAPRQG